MLEQVDTACRMARRKKEVYIFILIKGMNERIFNLVYLFICITIL
jgi:hypothetical protein